MELFSTAGDFIGIVAVFFVGICVAQIAAKPLRAPVRRSLVLYCWHTVFCVIYALYISQSGGDAVAYYQAGLSGAAKFSLGTSAIDYMTIFFASLLGLSFLGTFLAYNIFGFIGLLAFDSSLRSATADKSRIVRQFATLVVFLPSVSFWSSAIGKDSLSFMATGLALWAALNLKRSAWLMIAAILIMLLVRPHIAGIMIMALAASEFIQPRIPLPRRLILGGLALAASIVMVPFAMDFVGLGNEASANDLTRYIEQRQQYNHESEGGIDISSMSVPMQLFTYLFRPLPFESHTIPALAAGADNMVLLFLFAAGAWQLIKRRKHALSGNRVFMWLYVLLTWVLLATTTANLGLSMRQKWMFAPMLIFLLISLLGKSRQRKLKLPRSVKKHETV